MTVDDSGGNQIQYLTQTSDIDQLVSQAVEVSGFKMSKSSALNEIGETIKSRLFILHSAYENILDINFDLSGAAQAIHFHYPDSGVILLHNDLNKDRVKSFIGRYGITAHLHTSYLKENSYLIAYICCLLNNAHSPFLGRHLQTGTPLPVTVFRYLPLNEKFLRLAASTTSIDERLMKKFKSEEMFYFKKSDFFDLQIDSEKKSPMHKLFVACTHLLILLQDFFMYISQDDALIDSKHLKMQIDLIFDCFSKLSIPEKSSDAPMVKDIFQYILRDYKSSFLTLVFQKLTKYAFIKPHFANINHPLVFQSLIFYYFLSVWAPIESHASIRKLSLQKAEPENYNEFKLTLARIYKYLDRNSHVFSSDIASTLQDLISDIFNPSNRKVVRAEGLLLKKILMD